MANPKSMNIWQSKYGGGLKHMAGVYNQGIKNTPADFLSPEFLTPIYQQVGRGQMQQMQGLRDQYGAALGANSSGMLGREMGAVAGAAPYGAANIAARQAGFNRFQQLGAGLQGLKSLESAWRSARTGEKQAGRSLDLQEEALENGMFMSGAGAGGSGGLDQLSSILSALGPLLQQSGQGGTTGGTGGGFF